MREITLYVSSLRRRQNRRNRHTLPLCVILSVVEISPNEERGEIKERSDAGIS